MAISVLIPFLPVLGHLAPIERLNPMRGGRISGVFFNPNSTGFALYCGFAGCLCFYHHTSRRSIKGACLLLALLYAGAILVTLSRASILVTLLTLFGFVYTLWRTPAHRWMVVFGVVALTWCTMHRVLSSVDPQKLRLSRLTNSSLYEGDTFRLHGLRAAASHADRLFFLGEGTGQFTERSHVYLKDVLLPHIRTASAKAAHNQVVALWVEWGVLALILVYAGHGWVILRGLIGGLLRTDAAFMLLTSYVAILLYLQLHEVNSPASCALLGLCAGRAFQMRPHFLRPEESVLTPMLLTGGE